MLLIGVSGLLYPIPSPEKSWTWWRILQQIIGFLGVVFGILGLIDGFRRMKNAKPKDPEKD